MSEEEMDMEAFVDEEETSGPNSELGSKTHSTQPPASSPLPVDPKENVDFKFEIIQWKEVMALLKGKVLELQGKFEFSDIEKGVFWTALRENNYLLKVAARRLEDKIFDLMEAREMKRLDSNKKHECGILGDALSIHEVTHFGCGHTFSKECMKEYIDNEITTKGRNSINSTCPKDGCKFLLLPEYVTSYCSPEMVKRFDNYLISDFLEKYPCISKCAFVNCELYLVGAETDLTSKGQMPTKDCSCNCGFLTCLQCKSSGHQPINCQMNIKWRQEIEGSVDKLNLLWKKNNTKKCPKCKVDIFKNTGCMHMVCFSCKHDFCWLCLGSKEEHGNQHIASCNRVIEDKQLVNEGKTLGASPSEDKELSKLKICINTYLENENSLKIMHQRFGEILQINSGTHPAFEMINKFLQRFPGNLNFYVDAFRETIAARSFLMHTYPLQFTIKNQQEILLYLESLSLFQISLENATNLLEKNPMESFVMEVKGLVCPVEDFEKRKAEINAMRLGLSKHYTNLKKELSSEAYLKKVQENVNIDLSQIVKKGGTIQGKKKADKDELWTCFYCQKGNKGPVPCQGCNKDTYVESLGAWVCPFCSNPNLRTSEVCNNGYCKKGKRPTAGVWKCSACDYENTANLSNKCRACNQIGN